MNSPIGRDRISLAACVLVAFLCSIQVAPSAQDATISAPRAVNKEQLDNYSTRSASTIATDADWEAFKSSRLYVEPFEAAVIALPKAQLDLQRSSAVKDLALFQKILDDAVETRNNFAANTRLMLRWTGELLSQILQDQREELKLTDRHKPNPSFFKMMANFITNITDTSTEMKRRKNYTKRNIDVAEFKRRVENLFTSYKDILNISPVGNYLRWDRAEFYKEEPRRLELGAEATDLLAVS